MTAKKGAKSLFNRLIDICGSKLRCLAIEFWLVDNFIVSSFSISLQELILLPSGACTSYPCEQQTDSFSSL